MSYVAVVQQQRNSVMSVVGNPAMSGYGVPSLSLSAFSFEGVVSTIKAQVSDLLFMVFSRMTLLIIDNFNFQRRWIVWLGLCFDILAYSSLLCEEAPSVLYNGSYFSCFQNPNLTQAEMCESVVLATKQIQKIHLSHYQRVQAMVYNVSHISTLGKFVYRYRNEV